MRPIYKHGENTYIILGRVLADKFHNKENEPNLEHVKTYRDWLGADHVLRDQTHFLFCETIQDVEFEEILEDQI